MKDTFKLLDETGAICPLSSCAHGFEKRRSLKGCNMLESMRGMDFAPTALPLVPRTSLTGL